MIPISLRKNQNYLIINKGSLGIHQHGILHIKYPPTHSCKYWRMLDYIGQKNSIKSNFDYIIAHIALFSMII